MGPLVIGRQDVPALPVGANEGWVKLQGRHAGAGQSPIGLVNVVADELRVFPAADVEVGTVRADGHGEGTAGNVHPALGRQRSRVRVHGEGRNLVVFLNGYVHIVGHRIFSFRPVDSGESESWEFQRGSSVRPLRYSSQGSRRVGVPPLSGRAGSPGCPGKLGVCDRSCSRSQFPPKSRTSPEIQPSASGYCCKSSTNSCPRPTLCR